VSDPVFTEVPKQIECILHLPAGIVCLRFQIPQLQNDGLFTGKIHGFSLPAIAFCTWMNAIIDGLSARKSEY